MDKMTRTLVRGSRAKAVLLFPPRKMSDSEDPSGQKMSELFKWENEKQGTSPTLSILTANFQKSKSSAADFGI